MPQKITFKTLAFQWAVLNNVLIMSSLLLYIMPFISTLSFLVPFPGYILSVVALLHFFDLNDKHPLSIRLFYGALVCIPLIVRIFYSITYFSFMIKTKTSGMLKTLSLLLLFVGGLGGDMVCFLYILLIYIISGEGEIKFSWDGWTTDPIKAFKNLVPGSVIRNKFYTFMKSSNSYDMDNYQGSGYLWLIEFFYLFVLFMGGMKLVTHGYTAPADEDPMPDIKDSSDEQIVAYLKILASTKKIPPIMFLYGGRINGSIFMLLCMVFLLIQIFGLPIAQFKNLNEKSKSKYERSKGYAEDNF